jgi:hypothetical protein
MARNLARDRILGGVFGMTTPDEVEGDLGDEPMICGE